MKRNWRQACGMLLLCCLLAGVFPGWASAAEFRDVPAGHWAKQSISRCAEKGFFQGKTADQFGLGQSMTRSAAVVVLDRFFGWEDANFSLPYTDVPADAWYAGALRSAYANGAVTGQSQSFRPADPITREELAVMLIRALEYGAISGTAQELPRTFTDIDINEGYIAMARDFGLVTGIREDTFAPNRAATREQVAVILMRLYDKLHGAVPASMEIVSSVKEMGGLDTVAVKGATLSSAGAVRDTLSDRQVREIRTAAGERKQLLYVSGTAAFLNKKADAAAKNLAQAVGKGAYGGLVLEINGVSAEQRERMTAFVGTLHTALEGGELVLIVPAPIQTEHGAISAAGGYDYAALSSCAEQLILRIARTVSLVGQFPAAPLEPLDQVYRSLAQLRISGVDLAKVSLMLTAEGVYYSGKSERDRLAGQEILRKQDSGWLCRYSDRYGCAYLEKPDANEAIWYLNREAAEARLQMLKLSGVGGICMEAPANALAEVRESIR